MDEQWGKAEIEGTLGIARGRLQEWINAGWIVPREPARQGVAAKFDRRNLHEIWFINRAISFGVSRIEAFDMLKFIGQVKYLVRIETEVVPTLRSAGTWKPTNKLPERKDGEHKKYMVVDLEMLIAEVDKALV